MENKTKQLISGQVVRQKILRGLTLTVDAIASTLGSRGRNVAMELNWGAPLIVHDGVTVAKEITLEDPYENMAAQLVIQAAKNTNKEAGDGTTTASILIKSIYVEGDKLLSSGVNPQIIRKGIDIAVKAIVEELKRMATPIKTLEEMVDVATVSAADRHMGELIAKAVQKVGRNGVVTVQDGHTADIEVEYKEGMEFDNGFLGPWMINREDDQSVLFESSQNKETDNPFVILFDDEVTGEKLVTVLEKVYTYNVQSKVLIIANDFDTQAIQTLILNRIRGNKQLAAVKSPDFGEHRTNLLFDMAVVTGGKVIGGTNGIPVEEATIDDFGKVERVIVTLEKTILAGGAGKPGAIEKRAEGIKKMMDNAETEFKKDKLQIRYAKLKGGVAVINVGAASEQEQRELKERVIDAVNATQASVDEGIVPGGGVALVRASKCLDKLIEAGGKEAIGIKIVKEAVKYPLLQLVDNAGTDEDSGYVLGTIMNSKDKNLGYNVETERFENMVKSGIIDPVKVGRSALQNAASGAIMLLTTDHMISFKRETENKKSDEADGIGQFPS